MRRAAAVLVFGLLLCTASLASAQKAIDITPDYIVGIKLGMTQAQAPALMTKPVRLDRLEDGYLRLVSGEQKVEAYFRTGTKGVAVVTTWNRQLKTDEQIGPCSTVRGAEARVRLAARPVPAGGAGSSPTASAT